MGTLAFIVAVLLITFSSQIASGIKRLGTFLYSHMPSVKGASLKEATAGIFSASIEIWKVLAIFAAGWFFLGSGWPPALPTTWNIPSWFHISSLPLHGMRVMILEETSPSKPLTNEQSLALRSLEVRDYLDAKTLADSKGGKGWRKLDPDSSTANLPQEWQDIRAKLKPTESPWVAIADSTGRIVFEGPYPASETLAFFKKYGG